MLLTIVFWVASLAVVYPYVLYPLLLRLLVALRPRGDGTPLPAEPPFVTLIISAFNEAASIGQKLENTLALDYPTKRLQIIVASDASTDATDDIVRAVAARDPRVTLIRQAERRGKSAALNVAVAAAKGDIVVFSDANAMYEPVAIREL